MDSGILTSQLRALSNIICEQWILMDTYPNLPNRNLNEIYPKQTSPSLNYVLNPNLSCNLSCIILLLQTCFINFRIKWSLDGSSSRSVIKQLVGRWQELTVCN